MSSAIAADKNEEDDQHLSLTLALGFLAPPPLSASSSDDDPPLLLSTSHAVTVASTFGTFLLPILYHCQSLPATPEDDAVSSPSSSRIDDGVSNPSASRIGLFSKRRLIEVAKGLGLKSADPSSAASASSSSEDAILKFRGKLISRFNTSLHPALPAPGATNTNDKYKYKYEYEYEYEYEYKDKDKDKDKDKEQNIVDRSNWFIEALQIDELWKARQNIAADLLLPRSPRGESRSRSTKESEILLSPDRAYDSPLASSDINTPSQSLLTNNASHYISIHALPLVHTLLQVSSLGLSLQAFVDLLHIGGEENGTMSLGEEVFDDVVDVGVLRFFLFQFFSGVKSGS
jgi:hypothetical protein